MTKVKGKDMSFKTLRKRIALVATASLGFGLVSAVPASAAVYDGTIVLASATITTATATTATGTAVSSTFKLTDDTAGPGAGDYVTYVLTVAAPAASALNNTGSQLNGIVSAGTTAATFGTAKFLTTGAATVTDWAVSPTNVTDGTVTVTNGALIDESTGTTSIDALRGGISINPDVPGTYTVTLTATPFGPVGGTDVAGPAVTDTFVVTATANTGTLSSITLSNKAVASSDTAVAQRLTYTNGSATITAGGGTPFATAQIGSSVWTNEDGFIGTISAVTTAGGGTVATLATAYAGTDRSE